MTASLLRVLTFVPLCAFASQGVSQNAGVGDPAPDYSFSVLEGGDGRIAFDEFYGQPVFIVNWTDTDFGRGAAERLNDFAQDYVPKGLVSILHDSHNKTHDEIDASLLRLFPDNVSWRTRTRKLPFDYEDNGPPPDIALLGVDGTVLIAGSYTTDFGKATKLVKSELKKLKKGWGEHKTARKARALAFGKFALADAKALVEEALAEEPGHAELRSVLAEIEARHGSLVRSVRYLLERGEFVRARDVAESLVQSVDGHAAWQGEAQQLVESFDEPALRLALEWDERLAAIVATMSKGKPKPTHVRKLQTLADQAEHERVAERAMHFAETAERAIGDH